MQVTQCRGGRQQGCDLAGREFADQPGERLRPGPSAGAQVVRARRGQRHQHHPLISRIRPPLGQACPRQDRHERRHRRLGDSLGDRKVGDAPWPGPLHRGQRRRRRQADIPGLMPYRGRQQRVDRPGGRNTVAGVFGFLQAHFYENS
jgi:hypothetical protein